MAAIKPVRAGQQEHGADAAGGEAVDALAEFVVDVGGGHHGRLRVRARARLAMRSRILRRRCRRSLRLRSRGLACACVWGSSAGQ